MNGKVEFERENLKLIKTMNVNHNKTKMARNWTELNDILYRYRVITDTEYGLVLQCVL